MAVPVLDEEGDEGRSQGAHSALLEFASAEKARSSTEKEGVITEDLEGIIRCVAQTGAAACYPWDALRLLLARKVELVLGDFWRDAPDLELRDGETFWHVVVEPLTRSLLEPRREGAPWTSQRLCELLSKPQRSYRSTRKFLFALQRAILVTTTEEEIVPRQRGVSAVSAEGSAASVPEESTVDSTAAAVAAAAAATAAPFVGLATGREAGCDAEAPSGRKRKLPEELSNGVASE
eukprot:TRINITY_DN70428_c0_g1_i1.p1 TRINITY_DN70428_c0_g1~~TRINITY_DN70428_c0_g1_i1.p1  ORF type:complete len:235 (-),score=45.16 TRINITY_DN70428_c0_g1_i1:20-724(-)